MYGVNGGVNFPNNYYGKNTKSHGVHDQNKAPETKTHGRKDEILFSSANRKGNGVAGLSDEAKSLLAELKEKYKSYDFMIADYETDEEADQLLSQGKGEYNVLITPDLLEKMASDKSERAKYEDIIAGASEKFGEIEDNLTKDGKSVIDKLGFTVKEDGTVDYYAKLINDVTHNSHSVKSSLTKELSRMVNQYAETLATMRKDLENKREEEFKVEKNPNEVEDPYHLSEGAKAVLRELNEKYEGYDFIVGKWKTDEEASRVLSYGMGKVANALIDPDLLEKMAADPSEKAKIMGVLDNAKNDLDKVENSLSKDGKSIIDKLGFTVKNDGTVDYYAKLVNGVTHNNSKSIKASLANELSSMVNKIAENRAKAIEEAKKRHEDLKVEKNPNEVKDPYNLSEGAKAVLRELIEKYEGYDFIVGKWKTDEEASRVLSYGMGRDGNVLINPDLLEKMAADESVKAKYMGIIDEAASNLDKAEKELSEDGRSIVEKLGLTIGADGSVSYFAKLVGGVTTDDGGDYIKCSIIEDFTKSLEAIAKTREKVLENRDKTDKPKLDTPKEKKEKAEKSVMPPKSFEKYEKEKKPYSTEEDFGNLPPESFKKYQSEADAHAGDKGDTMNFSV